MRELSVVVDRQGRQYLDVDILERIPPINATADGHGSWVNELCTRCRADCRVSEIVSLLQCGGAHSEVRTAAGVVLHLALSLPPSDLALTMSAIHRRRGQHGSSSASAAVAKGLW